MKSFSDPCVADDCEWPERQSEETEQQHGFPHQTLTETVQGDFFFIIILPHLKLKI